MKIVFSRDEIVALVLTVVIIKAGLYFYPSMEPYFAESAYIVTTSGLEEKTVQVMEIEGKEKSNNVYYIGRPNCADCRMSIKNIKRLYQICNKGGNRKMYYVELKKEITDSERRYLDSISVDSIPTIIRCEGGEVVQFGYDEINSAHYEKAFKRFLN